ncbi:hypothetical protein [Streptomyces asoensis]|uniref:hypothetical protein n=1 Tax=Streptomyces asoensis TaxID=249586 RepID=UPI003407F0A8
MNHHQSPGTLEINTRLLTTGVVLTAVGAVTAWAGMAITASAVFAAGRRMVREMDVPPAQQAAEKLRRAREASRAGMQAWQSTSGTQA